MADQRVDEFGVRRCQQCRWFLPCRSPGLQTGSCGCELSYFFRSEIRWEYLACMNFERG
jgi:hypothetical protein